MFGMRVALVTGLVCGLGTWGQASLGQAQAQAGARQLPGHRVAAGARGGSDGLEVFFVDVEGGQATLFVTPGERGGAKHSLLIDTGWPERGGRDADRIAAAAHKAGLSRIDAVLLTHYHDDHTGGVPNLVARIPVGMFIDHGPNREMSDATTEGDYEAYQKVLATGKYKHVTAKVGDVLPVEGMRVEVISADGAVLDKPLPGTRAGQANEYCAQSPDRPEDTTENARSLGVEITFGAVKILDLGDLTWQKEKALMCPVNKLGHVDVLVVSHHGWNQSSSPALVDALGARVAVMDNGATKGGSKETVATLRAMPGLADLYQLHYSEEAAAGNGKEALIANLQGSADADKAYGFALRVDRDGSLTMTNGRTGAVKRYAAQEQALAAKP